MSGNKKLMIIGLDCATPRTLFKDFLDDCPNIKRMTENGVYGKLRSSDPPITIPAWMVMATGKDAGTLGVYGFRHRVKNSYTDFWIANSYTIKEPKVWDIIAEGGKKSCILGIPPTFPVQPINGSIVSGFITPDITSDYTYPADLKKEIEEKVGEYILDVKFRTEEKEELLSNIYNMTRIHFKTVKYLIKNKKWDYFHFVIIGLDRLHHAFWKHYDKLHQKYELGNKFENEIRKYYKYLDKEIGEILEILNDNTTVIIASDHGAKAMKGCLCVNMALEKLGLLKFKTNPEPGTKFENADVDWDRTYAWGWGGYYARIFLNVEGREEKGIIKQEDYEKMKDDITKKIKSIKDDNNNPMNTVVFKPEEIFSILNGDPPDLMVYFDDLNWRSAGTVGYNDMYLKENDTGPDDAVHDYYGVFVIYDPKKKIGIDIGIKNILDIAPTALHILGIKIPNDMKGEIIKI